MNQSQIQSEFEDLIKNNPWWSRFVGSQFIRMFIVFIAQMVYRCMQYASRSLQEGFISTASKRSSILAAAEDRGYVGRRISPSTGIAILKNLSERELQLPIYTKLLSDDQHPYMIMDAIEVPINESKIVVISQLEKITITKTVTKEEEFLSVIIPIDISALCHQLDVYVTIDGIKTQWKETPQFRLAKNTTKAYVQFYKPTEQIGIRFGDGSIGMIPPVDSIITIDVWCTSGDITLVDGQNLIPIDEFDYLANSLSIITNGPITGGASAETTEETRNRAQYSVAYDHQVVWGGDYTYFLRSNIGGITWLKVWGEKQQEEATGKKDLANINNIFISGHKPTKTQEEFESEIRGVLHSIPNDLNKTYTYVKTNEKPFTIEITGVVSASLVISDVIVNIKKALEIQFARDSERFDKDKVGNYQTIKLNELWAFVDEMKLIPDFDLVAHNMSKSNGLNDFVYLDVENSVFNLHY